MQLPYSEPQARHCSLPDLPCLSLPAADASHGVVAHGVVAARLLPFAPSPQLRVASPARSAVPTPVSLPRPWFPWLLCLALSCGHVTTSRSSAWAPSSRYGVSLSPSP